VGESLSLSLYVCTCTDACLCADLIAFGCVVKLPFAVRFFIKLSMPVAALGVLVAIRCFVSQQVAAQRRRLVRPADTSTVRGRLDIGLGYE
jgi:hypothetical protein